LITTPESLYLLLTSQAREILRPVETVIVDEIHSLVATKRGAHLFLSLERLQLQAGRELQRIGLSATQRPLDEVARLLGGGELIRANRSPVIFVNSRRPAERLAGALNDLAGSEVALAHQGSVARDKRQEMEDRLKRGALPAIVATSSLELGIDMGSVDLVVQI